MAQQPEDGRAGRGVGGREGVGERGEEGQI